MDWTLCHGEVGTLLDVVNFGTTIMVSSCTLAAIIANSSWTIFAQASMSLPSHPQCRNPSLGLVTKTKACKGAGQEECERV
jgi:hypothetical protein